MRFLYFIILVSFYSCKKKELSTSVMYPVHEVYIDDVQHANYERVLGVDLFMFEKQMEDTTTVLEFEDVDKKANRISWEIKIDANNTASLDKLISKYGCVNLGKLENTFILNCWSSNTIMLGHFIEVNGEKKIRISYQLPLTNKE